MIEILLSVALVVFILSQIHVMILRHKRNTTEIERAKLSIEVLKLELKALDK